MADDEMRAEYDLAGGVRGKYYHRLMCRCGHHALSHRKLARNRCEAEGCACEGFELTRTTA